MSRKIRMPCGDYGPIRSFIPESVGCGRSFPLRQGRSWSICWLYFLPLRPLSSTLILCSFGLFARVFAFPVLGPVSWSFSWSHGPFCFQIVEAQESVSFRASLGTFLFFAFYLFIFLFRISLLDPQYLSCLS